MRLPDKPVHLIVNPQSGYGGQKYQLKDLREEIRRTGREVREFVTRHAGHASDLARDLDGKASAVVVFGGDGTVNEVANGLVGSDVPMLVAPAGTENLLAKELRIPRRPADLAGLLEHGRIMPCDIGIINDCSFHSIIGVGFDAEVVRRLSVTRTGHISHLSYFWPMWRTFWEHDFPDMRIEADGELLYDGQGLAFVGNISRYSVGLRICRDARFDDGLLDLVIFQCNRQDRLLLHAAWTLLRMHPLKGNVIYRPAREIRIETRKPMTCEVDGDVGPETPLDIRLAPQAIRLIVPTRPSRWTPPPIWPWRGEAPV